MQNVRKVEKMFNEAYQSAECVNLGVLLCSDMKTSIDVCCQTSRFYAQANTLLRNFRYCSDDVKCMLFRSFCTNMYCSPSWFNSTSSNIKKIKTSYNGALRRLLLIKTI